MPLPKGQQWFISRMQKMGYASDSKGVCFGLAHMAMQAILADEIDVFDERLEKINSLSLDSMVQTINDLKDKRTKTKNLPIDPLLEIPVFFDGVELYHQAYLYPSLFEEENKPTAQNAMATAPLIVPQVFKENDIEIGSPDNFTGAYNQQNLIGYFQSLRSAIRQNRPPLLKPFTMILRSGNHAITVAYDPRKDEWLFIDPNELPTQHIKGSNNIIAKKVASAFSRNGMTNFITEIYTTNTNETAIKACINSWKNRETWKKIHTVSTNKATAVDSFNTSWLYIAAKKGRLKTVNTLLAAGANVDLACTDGATPLYVAAQNGHLNVVKALLAKNAKVDLATTTGITALLIAAEKGHLEIVKALLAKNAKVDLATITGITALLIAAEKGHLEIVKALLAKNAKVDLATPTGATALLIAAEKGHLEIVNALLDAGADVNLACTEGATALLIAAENGHLEIVNALLDAGADVNRARTDDGATALYIAVQEGHLEVVKALLNANANVDLAYTNGSTALFIAAQNGNFNIVRLLLSKGAKMNAALKSDAQSLREFAKEYNVESRMNALIEEKQSTSTISITCEEIATVMGHSKVNETLINFKKLEKSAVILRNIANIYHSSTLFHSENKEQKTRKIIDAINEAYCSFANGVEIDEIINILRKTAKSISPNTKKDYSEESFTLFTKSGLAKQIDAALPLNKVMS